jgi:hypothetical protein
MIEDFDPRPDQATAADSTIPPMSTRPRSLKGVRRIMASPRLPYSALALLLAMAATTVAEAQVYRWVDNEGVTHLSSEKPPRGVQAERLDVPGTTRRSNSSATRTASTGSVAATAPAVSPARQAEREDVLGRLRTRECVIALEALERKTAGAETTSAAEIKRLKQTADLNCSDDPTRRRQQEEMAMQLRMANSPACDEARDRLWNMLEPDSGTPREQLRRQQAYVDGNCTPPVR